MKKILMTGLMGLLLAVALNVSARDPLQNPRLVKALGLTKAQTAKLEQIRFDYKASMIKLRSEMQLKKLDMEREMNAENPDRAKLNKLVDELSAVRSRMAKARISHGLDVKKILTPEQWNKLKELKAAFKGQMRGRRGARGSMQGRSRGHGMRGAPGAGFNGGPGMGPGHGEGPEPDMDTEPGPGM